MHSWQTELKYFRIEVYVALLRFLSDKLPSKAIEPVFSFCNYYKEHQLIFVDCDLKYEIYM